MKEPTVGDIVSEEDLPKYLKVDGWDDVYVNANGTIITLPDRMVVFRTEPPKSGKNNYRTYTRNNRYKYHHQIVLETHSPDTTSGIVRRVPNHLNGVRWDNRLSNLEWATDSENGKHAYRELGYVGKPPTPMNGVRLKDLVTGEIIELGSLNAVGRYLNISLSTAKKYLGRQRNKPLALKYDISTESHDFAGFTIDDVGKMSFNTHGVYAVTADGTYQLLIRDRNLAGKLVALSTPALNKQLSLKAVLFRAGWIITPVNPWNMGETIDEFDLVETEADLPKLALEVTRPDKSVKLFQTVMDAAYAFKLSEMNMALQISKRGKRDLFNGYQFRWVTAGK